MDKYLHFQGGREKAIFTFMMQQIKTEKNRHIHNIRNMFCTSIGNFVLSEKNVALKLCHYCFMWKPLIQNIVAFIFEKRHSFRIWIYFAR